MPSLLEDITRVPVDSLALYPGNARKGDLQAIAASLREHGQVTPLVVQLSTRRVLGGNNTLQAARDILGWTEIDVAFVDVDDTRARKINTVLNRTADLATYDDGLLLAQLADLDGDLEGSGYGLDDMAELRRVTGQLGADATAFLAGFGDNPPPAPGTPPPGPPPAGSTPPAPGAAPQPGPGPDPAPARPAVPEFVQVSWVVTPPARDTIRSALTLAQLRDGLETSAEALHTIALYYLSTQTT